MTPTNVSLTRSGAWVRYLIGTEDNTPVYRLCEVVGMFPFFYGQSGLV